MYCNADWMSMFFFWDTLCNIFIYVTVRPVTLCGGDDDDDYNDDAAAADDDDDDDADDDDGWPSV